MKKVLVAIAAILSLSVAYSQKFQATIKPGTLPNSVKIFVRPDAAVSGTISTLQFCLTVPSTVTPKPTTTIISTPTGYAWFPVSETSPKVGGGGSYHSYTYFLSSSPTGSFTAGTEFEIAEVAFGGSVGVANVGLACFEDDGTTIDYFSISIGILSDAVLVSAPLYGTGATVQPWLTGFSFVQLSNISLPVKFLSFFALKNGDDAKLNWTVESDDNNRYFDIERSTDGRVYTSIAKVNAKANGKSVNTYETTDAGLSKLGANVVYYRIKQTDKSGEITYSNVKNLNNVKKSTPVQLFPNPVKTITKVVVDADVAGKGSIVIRDISGKLIRQINAQFVKGINQQDINVADLASGDYNVQVIGEGFTYQLKLSKIN